MFSRPETDARGPGCVGVGKAWGSSRPFRKNWSAGEAVVGRVGSGSTDPGVTVMQDPNSNSDSASSAVGVPGKENISGEGDDTVSFWRVASLSKWKVIFSIPMSFSDDDQV